MKPIRYLGIHSCDRIKSLFQTASLAKESFFSSFYKKSKEKNVLTTNRQPKINLLEKKGTYPY